MSDLARKVERRLTAVASTLDLSRGLAVRGVVTRVADDVAWVAGLDQAVAVGGAHLGGVERDRGHVDARVDRAVRPAVGIRGARAARDEHDEYERAHVRTLPGQNNQSPASHITSGELAACTVDLR